MAASIVRLRAEERVNTIVEGGQGDPRLTKLKDGGWVIVWRSVDADGKIELHQQRFNKDGSADGDETRIDTTDRGAVLTVTTAALDDGGWVVTWIANDPLDPSSTGYGVYLRRFDRNGEPVGSEQVVSPADDNWQFHANVTGIDGGGWVVTWQSSAPNSLSGSEIHQQEYGADGKPKGAAVQVNTTTDLDQSAPIYHPPDRRRLDRDLVLHRPERQVRCLSAALHTPMAIASMTRSRSTPRRPQASCSPAWRPWRMVVGSSLGCRTNRTAVRGHLSAALYADGTRHGRGAKGQYLHCRSTRCMPSSTALADGGWVVTWAVRRQDGNGNGVYQQRYDDEGHALGGEQQVNARQRPVGRSPSVTTLADGGWVVTWNPRQDREASGIYQRRYKAWRPSATGSGARVRAGRQRDLRRAQRRPAAGDSLEAGGGIDTLRMIEAGILDLTAPAVLTGIEIVQGSGGNDIIVADEARLIRNLGIQGGAGTDALHLKAGSYDFTAKFVSGFEAITLLGTGSLTFADKATALLAHSQTHRRHRHPHRRHLHPRGAHAALQPRASAR